MAAVGCLPFTQELCALSAGNTESADSLCSVYRGATQAKIGAVDYRATRCWLPLFAFVMPFNQEFSQITQSGSPSKKDRKNGFRLLSDRFAG